MKTRAIFNVIVNKLFFYDKWNIGYLAQSPENFINSRQLNGKINWLPEDSVEYAADPFAIDINGSIHLYYEELNFWNGKGEIMMINTMNFNDKKKVKGISKHSAHLSYPYLFKAENNIYCIPETSSEKQVALYQVDVEKPYQFNKVRVILEGRPFVDSSIIFFENKYWLFTSVSENKRELYLFYSDTLDSPFKAHSLNPISVAPTVSRSAGRLFIVKQKLYMPSQNPEKCYGGSVMINEITKLSETDFQYKTVFQLLPRLPYNEGLHTVNFTGDLLIVDGKRKVFSALTPLKKMVRNIRNRNKA
jgi:hypothetical protein